MNGRNIEKLEKFYKERKTVTILSSRLEKIKKDLGYRLKVLQELYEGVKVSVEQKSLTDKLIESVKALI